MIFNLQLKISASATENEKSRVGTNDTSRIK